MAPAVVTRVQLRMPPQTPEMQLMPAPHCTTPPHRQPPGPQLSERCVSHAEHAPPLVPHWVTVPGERQLAPLQQPWVHEVASHTQALLKHRWPIPQAGLVPQRHAPLPQLFARAVSQG